MSNYRQRVHRSSRIVAAMMAVGVILLATPLGMGYSFDGLINAMATVMLLCLAIAATTRRKRTR